MKICIYCNLDHMGWVSCRNARRENEERKAALLSPKISPLVISDEVQQNSTVRSKGEAQSQRMKEYWARRKAQV